MEVIAADSAMLMHQYETPSFLWEQQVCAVLRETLKNISSEDLYAYIDQ
jgi:hypothetical protein